MDLNDLKVILGCFHHAESICDSPKAIGSSYSLFPVKNTNFWWLGTSNSRLLSTQADTYHVVLRFGAFSMMFVLKHMFLRSTKSVEVLAVSLIECNKVKTVI